MKKTIYRTLILAAFLFTAYSCELNQYPHDGIDVKSAWKTVQDAENFRTGMYRTFKNMNGGIFTFATDYQSDLFNATIGFGNNGGDLFRWDFTNSQYDITDLWRYGYNSILAANNIIDNIDIVKDLLVGTEAENKQSIATLDKIKGEAHLLRAAVYHVLVLRFAKTYRSETAGTDLGLPLVSEVGVQHKPSRATVQETYDFIKSEIVQARALLTVKGTANTIYFSADVIDALDARVNLYMGKYDDAIKSVENIVNSYPLVTAEAAFTNQWLIDSSTEFIMNNFSSVDERVNSFGTFLSFSTAVNAYSPHFLPTKWVVDLYETDDIRRKAFLMKSKITSSNISVQDVFMLSKYPGNPALKRTLYDYYHMGKPFRVAELYLIAAEAAYMKKDEVTAKKWLNDLRTARGASQITETGTKLFEIIKEEWVREFIGEGMRLDQLKRWGDGFTRKPPQNLEIVMKGDKYTILTIPANHMKFIWEIPANDLAANKNLKPNWVDE